MLLIKGRTAEASVAIKVGRSILDHALEHQIDVAFSCTRGTCARCRCFIAAGMDYLSPPSDAEYDRMDEEEIAQGYRLGCQAIVRENGEIKAMNKPYF